MSAMSELQEVRDRLDNVEGELRRIKLVLVESGKLNLLGDEDARSVGNSLDIVAHEVRVVRGSLI